MSVHHGDTSVELGAYTYCFDNGCADGMPPTDPPDVGSPDSVEIAFPLEDWTFEASFSPAGEQCGRVQTVPLRRTGSGTFLLGPVGYADTYDVTLFGRGGGDLFTVFRWTTPSDGVLPAPEARLAVLADHDGEVDSYGVELAVSNLASTPQDASAVITVAATDGASLEFAAAGLADCQPEGSLYWDGPDADGLAAAELGAAPFRYHVELTLDGIAYSADATWPDDQIAGFEPSVALRFSPALPGLPARG